MNDGASRPVVNNPLKIPFSVGGLCIAEATVASRVMFPATLACFFGSTTITINIGLNVEQAPFPHRTMPPERITHPCTFLDCPRSFDKAHRLSRHINDVHTKAKIFMCSVQGCGHKVTQKSNLKSHMWTHMKGKRSARGAVISGRDIGKCVGHAWPAADLPPPTHASTARRPVLESAYQPLAESLIRPPDNTPTSAHSVQPASPLQYIASVSSQLRLYATAFPRRAPDTERGPTRLYSPPPFPPPPYPRGSHPSIGGHASIPLMPAASSGTFLGVGIHSSAAQRDPPLSSTSRDRFTRHNRTSAVWVPAPECVIADLHAVGSGSAPHPTMLAQTPAADFLDDCLSHLLPDPFRQDH
ncbi:hypothetical protein BOTBODRAFT_193891 [Botryobasidium botryosum FD-172 SS1]|uniref:C2H2-type domain-containing protein n=1 Tax=Botryobasidium botryosum (strain FD-172 SS1) TaxID=930990 RepID=A0A067MZH5_BOTB1|nr:hypothetical protein BOTBODRAFT_193891 [Botryobasidium botryosum FD-172 SS1]